MLFFKYILYQKRTKFQAGIVVKKILTKIFANFLKNFVVFDEILPVFISKKDLERFDLEIFFSPKNCAKSYHYHDSLPCLKMEPVPIFFSQNMI